MAKSKRTIAVDFDGVVHAYTSPWVAPHVIPDPPVDGAIPWLLSMVRHFNVVIFTTRAKTWRGRRAIAGWLLRHGGENAYYDSPDGPGLENITISYEKIPAIVYVDDRAWRFEGTRFPTRDEIFKAVPWGKRKPVTLGSPPPAEDVPTKAYVDRTALGRSAKGVRHGTTIPPPQDIPLVSVAAIGKPACETACTIRPPVSAKRGRHDLECPDCSRIWTIQV